VRSLNAATAWTLMELVGLDDSYNYLVDMGVNPAHINKSGAGLALGTSGITPVEMAGAFAAIANAGVYQEPLSFTRVTDRNGNVILDAKEIRDSRQVFKPSTAWLLTDMLVEAVSSKSGTGRNARIEGMTVGGKTGTNQNAKGIYFVGFTPYYTMSLWIGHDDYKPLAEDVYASSSAAPLWQYIMAQLVKDKPDAPIIDASPEELGLTKVRVCSVSGKKATEACEADSTHKPVDAWYPSGSASALERCDWHQQYPVCMQSGKIATQYCPNDQIEMRSLLMLPDDSIYWKLTDAQLQKYLPGAQHALPGGLTLADIDPSMPEYASYFCNIHTLEWHEQQEALHSAISAANEQLRISNAVLTDPQYAMSLDDKQQLLDKINELNNLLSNPSATAAAIEQVTEELRQLTVRLVSIYSGMETDNP